MLSPMKSGRARRSRAWVVSGIVATAVVFGGGGPAPGQVPDPDGPEVVYVDAYGPILLGYEDCDGTIHTELDPYGVVFVELDYEVEAAVTVGLTYTGSLADDIADLPATVEIPAGDYLGVAEFTMEEIQEGDLTVTAEPGIGYTVSQDDTYTLEVTDEVEVIASCQEDLGTPPDGTDRQTIKVGERPLPIGFFEEEDEGDSGGEGSTTTEVGDTTESTTTTTEPVEEISAPLAAARSARAAVPAPPGYDTPVANGTLPPGLTYVDDVWAGAATTPGTYPFDVRLCLDQGDLTFEAGKQGGVRRPVPRAFPAVICFGYVDVEIVVEAVAPSTNAPAAQPVTAPARFAG